MLLSTSVFFSSVVCYNQQVVTGKLIQIGHFHWYFIYPFTLTLLFYWLVMLLRRLHPNLLVVVSLFTISISVYASLSTASILREELKTEVSRQTLESYLEIERRLSDDEARILVLDLDLERIVTANPGISNVWHKFGIHYKQEVQNVYNINSLIWMVMNGQSKFDTSSILSSCRGRQDNDCYGFFSLFGSDSGLSRDAFLSSWNSGSLTPQDLHPLTEERIHRASNTLLGTKAHEWLEENKLKYVLLPKNEIEGELRYLLHSGRTCIQLENGFQICPLVDYLKSLVGKNTL